MLLAAPLVCFHLSVCKPAPSWMALRVVVIWLATSFVLFLQTALAVCGVLWVFTNFRIVCSVSMKKPLKF